MLVSNYSIKFRTAVFVLAIVLAIAGAVAYMTLPREGMPDITIPYVYVTSIYEGTGPADIESLISIPLEKKLNDVDGIKEMRSVSAENMSIVSIKFIAGENIDLARQKVKDKVDLARQDLPEDLDEPMVTAFNISSDVPVFQLAISGASPPDRLRNIAEDLQERIETVSGVREAQITGTLEREIRVEIDLRRLISYGVPLGIVMQRIHQENKTVAAGNLELVGNKFQVRIPGEFEYVTQLKQILLTNRNGNPVYLTDVAEISDAYKDVESISRLNGEPCVAILIKKRTGENSVDLIDSVKQVIGEFLVPAGITLTTVYDESLDIDMMIKELENNVFSGFLLVVVVLMIFMGVRNSLFVGLAIPLSMLVAFTAMSMMGFSLNMMVLFSLVLAVGMLVDNAIVIVENIYRHRAEGMSRIEAARAGASEVAWPVITSTITTCAAFSPLLFWPDVMGQFMGFMPKTLIVVLFASLFVAIVINPAVCSALIKVNREKLKKQASKGEHGFVRWYERFLRAALKVRPQVLLLGILIMFLSIEFYALWGNGTELFPETEPRNAMINVKFPEGTTVERTDAVLRVIEKQLAQHEDIRFFLSRVGALGGFSLSASSGGTHLGYIHVEYEKHENRKGDTIELTNLIREEIMPVPGAEIRVEKQQEGPRQGDPVTIELSGDDFDVLSQYAGELVRKIETAPGLVDLHDDYEAALPELQFRVDRKRAAMFGLDTDSIGIFLRTSIYGLESSKFRADENEFDITLRLPRDQRSSLNLLDEIFIPLKDGNAVPLSSLGEVVYTGGQGAINRKNQKRMITLSGFNEKRDVKEIIDEEVKPAIEALDLPAGYTSSFAGDTQEMEESTAFLGRAFLIALGLILVVLVIQFNSILRPGIILLSVVLSIIGVMWGLLIWRLKFGVIMTGLGVISLAGIVVNNAIVLMSTILQQRGKGLVPVEAIVAACKIRLRPVLLTAVTTVLGLIPMAIGLSLEIHSFPPRLVTGSETSAWWAPMAVAVIFGLSVATILTLVIVPVTYSLIESLNLRFARDDGDE